MDRLSGSGFLCLKPRVNQQSEVDSEVVSRAGSEAYLHTLLRNG